MAIAGQWKGFGLTDIGRVRQTNQDTFLIDDELGLWIVADGMGGHAGGDVASQLAVETIRQYIADHVPSTDHSRSVDCTAIIQTAVAQANTTIRKRAKAEPALKGMGTTVVLVFMPNTNDENACIAHAGDSRAYLIRDKNISALTRDHTLLEERIQVGLLPRSTPSSHQLGHVLTRGVGVESTVEPELYLTSPYKGRKSRADSFRNRINEVRLAHGQLGSSINKFPIHFLPFSYFPKEHHRHSFRGHLMAPAEI